MAIKKSLPKRASSRPADGKKPFRRRGPKNKGVRPSDPNAQRLNKILASAGLGSRRDVEELILQGRVEIDREVITDLSCKVDPRAVVIKVDGSVLKKEQLIYYALNKPSGVLSTNRDPDGRMRVIDLVPDKHRVFSVGRLDRSSEGLILLTNDGELAQRLAHPKFAVQKAYFVVVSGVMTQEDLDKLRKGVHLAEGFARIDGASIRRQRKGCTEIEIVLSEGKNREIRRILARAGHKVVVLRRIAIGPLRLGQLPVGASRILLPSEVRALYAATEHKPVRSKKAVPAPAKASLKKPIKASRPLADMDDDALVPSQRAGAAARARPMFDDEDDDDDDLLPLGMASSRPDQLGDDWEGDDFGGGDVSDDAFDNDFDDAFDDDDFVGHFSSTTTGAVLGYDDDAPPDSSKPKRQSKKVAAKRSADSRSAQSAPQRGAARENLAAERGLSKHESNRAAGPSRKSAKGGKRGSAAASGAAGGGRDVAGRTPAGRTPAGRAGAGKKRAQPSKSQAPKSQGPKSRGNRGRK